MPPDSIIEASAPARVDLAGGTLDLWPLHVLHPASVTINLAIDRRAVCRVRRGGNCFRIVCPSLGFETQAGTAEELFADTRTALVGSLLEALEIHEFFEMELRSDVPFGSGLGGSSALTVALAAALEAWSPRDLSGVARIALVRDVETRALGKPAGVQDYYPALAGGLHRILFEAGSTRAERVDVDPEEWERHLTLFDTGAAHCSGMNNWAIYRARLEGDRTVADGLEAVRQAAAAMAGATLALDFPAMGQALRQEWEARRQLAPVVSSPAIDQALETALTAGAWGGKACGAGGGGCVVFLSPSDRTSSIREALTRLDVGTVLPVRAENRGLVVREPA